MNQQEKRDLYLATFSEKIDELITAVNKELDRVDVRDIGSYSDHQFSEAITDLSDYPYEVIYHDDVKELVAKNLLKAEFNDAFNEVISWGQASTHYDAVNFLTAVCFQKERLCLYNNSADVKTICAAQHLQEKIKRDQFPQIDDLMNTIAAEDLVFEISDLIEDETIDELMESETMNAGSEALLDYLAARIEQKLAEEETLSM